MLLAAFIFVLTLVFVIWQPRGLGIGWSASAGAVLALLTGVVQLGDIPVVWSIVWNATIAFVAIVLISLILDEAGFFQWAALHIARLANGSGNKLFVLIVLLGALVSAFFANDGAALILTPIVVSMLIAMDFGAAATLVFVMAAGFIADTASLPLVISNLVNIVSADFFNISFDSYAVVMVPVGLVSVCASLLVLWLFYRSDIPESYDLSKITDPNSAIVDKTTFIAGWLVLLLLLIGFFVIEPLGVPVSALASLAAVVLFLIASSRRIIDTKKVLLDAPWQIVIFSLGMYLVVYGLRNAGLTNYLSDLLSNLSGQNIWLATVGTGFLAAFLSSVMNNMPTVLIGALSIDGSTASGLVQQAMVYANVIGSDLGPKMTPIGSLATLLWLHVLNRKGISISWAYYFKAGVILTIPVLLITLSALAWWLSY